jgi:four helix bundle protein
LAGLAALNIAVPRGTGLIKPNLLDGATPMAFDYRRMIVYQRAVEYDDIACDWLDKLRKHDSNLADHAQRSGNSLLSNIVEGCSSDQPKVKAFHYRVAKREAEECAAAFEKALRRKWIPKDQVEKMLGFLDEVVRMLANLIRRFDP